MYDNDEQEMASLMTWLERRLYHADAIPTNVTIFKTMWYESFGTMDNIPTEFKKKVTARYHELKGAKPQ